LQNVIERAVVLAKGKIISVQDLGLEFRLLKEIKKAAIIEALDATNWNAKKAAQLLGISRNTMNRYIHKYLGKEQLNNYYLNGGLDIGQIFSMPKMNLTKRKNSYYLLVKLNAREKSSWKVS